MHTPNFFASVSYHLLAQAYGCSNYGEGNYNECETSTDSGGGSSSSSSSTSSSTSSSNSAGNGSSAGGDSNATDASSTTTSDQTPTTTTSPTSNTSMTQSSQSLRAEVADQVNDASWGILLPIILGLALLFAFLFVLWKRRRNKDDQPPTSGFTPPSQF